MKIKFFALLAVLFFAVNGIEAKDKPVKQKDTTLVHINESPIMNAIILSEQKEAQQKTIVFVHDTIVTDAFIFDFSKIDFSTPQNSRASIVYLIAFILAFIPRFVPKWREWIKKEKNLQTLKIIGSILAIIVPVFIFGKVAVNAGTLAEIIIAVAGLIGLLSSPINSITAKLSGK